MIHRVVEIREWAIEDRSIVSAGSDPTAITTWILTRGSLTIKVSEIFGDWSIDDEYVTNLRSGIDARLVSMDAPMTSEIETALDDQTPETDGYFGHP